MRTVQLDAEEIKGIGDVIEGTIETILDYWGEAGEADSQECLDFWNEIRRKLGLEPITPAD